LAARRASPARLADDPPTGVKSTFGVDSELATVCWPAVAEATVTGEEGVMAADDKAKV